MSLNVWANAATSGVHVRSKARRQRIVLAHRVSELIERTKRGAEEHERDDEHAR
jgi:hypothetical protein